MRYWGGKLWRWFSARKIAESSAYLPVAQLNLDLPSFDMRTAHGTTDLLLTSEKSSKLTTRSSNFLHCSQSAADTVTNDMSNYFAQHPAQISGEM